MSNRLMYLLSTPSPPRSERDRTDSWTAAARMPGRRRPHWATRELAGVR